MRPWTADIDPSTIPDAVLASERGRRNFAKRQNNRGGRPPVPQTCPACEQTYPSAREYRGHICPPPTQGEGAS